MTDYHEIIAKAVEGSELTLGDLKAIAKQRACADVDELMASIQKAGEEASFVTITDFLVDLILRVSQREHSSIIREDVIDYVDTLPISKIGITMKRLVGQAEDPTA